VLEGLEPRCAGQVDSSSQIFGRVEIEEGAEVINSVIRGPAIIGKRARIVNSFVGPFTSIYYEVVLENSEIEHSIVMEKSSISNVGRRIEDSLIGKDVEITRSPLRPEALRLMLGDNSRIGLI
jgi:glucose-1-phosphate thymidylyltransferase